MFRPIESAWSETAARPHAPSHLSASTTDFRANSQVTGSPYTSVACALRRGILCIGACLALTLVARLVDLSCALSLPQDESRIQFREAATASAHEVSRSALSSLHEFAQATASLGIASLEPLAAALGALALGSLLVIAAGRSPRAGATVTSLAISAALVASAESVGETFRSLSAHWLSLVSIAISLAALVVLVWRWIEDLALAAALAARVDAMRMVQTADQAMMRAVDSEASLVSERGIELHDSASRVLARVLVSEESSASAAQRAEPDPISPLIGFGSPLPPRPREAEDGSVPHVVRTPQDRTFMSPKADSASRAA